MFSGVYTPIITVFDGNDIDFHAQQRLVDRLIAAGVDGILFGGSIGEFHAMGMEHKRAYYAWAAKAVAGRVAALAGTGATCVAEAVELTAHARDCGMDGTVVISPYYFRLNDDALYRYYAAVAAVGLPVVLYNFPDRTGVSLSTPLVQALANDCPSIVGIKDTVDTISHTREIIAAVKTIRPDFTVLSGYDEYLAANALAGGDGVLCGLTNVAPEVFVQQMDLVRRGDWQGVARLQAIVNRLMALYPLTDPYVAAIKEAVGLRTGGISTLMMAPAAPATADQRGEVAWILSEAGLS